MSEKKEVQETIDRTPKEKVTEEEFSSVLKLISPGTNLRKALDGIVRLGKGALIVVEKPGLHKIIDGGFRVNCKFSYQKLIELSKLDGAMILSNDLKRISFANVLLTPISKIRTSETGTRHKAAERTAKQISGLVIAISEKRKEIVLFYKNKKYKIRDTPELVSKVNEYIQVLERQRQLFDSFLETLNKLELRNYVNLSHAIKTIQKGKVIQKISEELSKYLIELGKEGELLKTRLKEILHDVEEETNLIIKDYAKMDDKKATSLLNNLSYERLLDKDRILNILNYENPREMVNVAGWRLLSKTTLTDPEIAGIVKETQGFEKIVSSDIDKEFVSLPKDKFSLLKVELEKLKLGL